MSQWAKYSDELRRAFYDDNASEVAIFQAANAIGFDLVTEDKPRLEHLCRSHPSFSVRGDCLSVLLGSFADATWVPHALALLSDDESFFYAWGALALYRGRKPHDGIVPALAQSLLDRRDYMDGDWLEEGMDDLLRLLHRPKPSSKQDLIAEAEAIADSDL